MTRDEVLRRNKELDEIADGLTPLHESAIEARDAAQRVVDEYQKFRSRILALQLKNLKDFQEGAGSQPPAKGK